MTGLAHAAVQVLAATQPSPSPSPSLAVDPDRVTPGFLGLAFVVVLGFVVFLLWKSLNKQVKRVDFDESTTENPRYTRKKAEREAQQAALKEAQRASAEQPPTDLSS